MQNERTRLLTCVENDTLGNRLTICGRLDSVLRLEHAATGIGDRPYLTEFIKKLAVFFPVQNS